MKITHKTEGLEVTLTLNFEQKDWKKTQDKLKEYSKQANLKGFRQGYIPMAELRKKFKDAVIGDVLKIASNKMAEYLTSNNLDTLYQPVVSKLSWGRIDWIRDNEFDFEFYAGLKPTFSTVYPKGKLTQNVINPTKKLFNYYLDDVRMRFGIKGEKAPFSKALYKHLRRS